MSLANNQQILGDWKFDWKVGDELRKLKPGDVSRVAARYFTRDNKTIVFLRNRMRQRDQGPVNGG